MLIQPWTGNNTNFTIPFYRFWDPDWADVIYDGPIKTLYPPNVEDFTQQMQDEIKEHFYYRQIGDESPQKFLRHFQQTIRLRAHLWKRLIDTETALRPDDAIYNYDMQESAIFDGTNTGETTATGNADVTNTDKATCPRHQMAASRTLPTTCPKARQTRQLVTRLPTIHPHPA